MRASQWIVSTLVGFGLFAEQAAAADAVDRYPGRPIRIVVGGTPGSTPDVLARLIGARLGDAWRQAIRQKLSAEVGRILAMPDVRERLSGVAFHITPSTPHEHDKKLRADIAAFAAIVKEIGLHVN